MLTCINKNSAEYQTLKERSGISDFMLEAICRDFLDKYDRFPYLDEIIGSNSDPHIRKSLQLDSYNSTNIDNILSITGASTIELANISLNDLYRDVEVEITPLNKDAIVEITKRPTEDNFDNWTEEDEILAKASRNSEGQLLAPNGKPSNLTEKQYAQVRTKAFKRWFGDWENDPANASKVVDENGEPLVVYHGSKSILNVFDPSKSESRQYLSQQIKPTNFFSSDKTVADFFALTENQSLASQISKSISIVLDAFAGENIDEDILDDEVWTEAARRTGKSKEFVKDFWENKVPREYKMHDDFGTTRMKDPDINKYKYNVFLNMKSPIILDAKGERADRFIEDNKEVLNNNDEVIIININETVGKKDTATDYLVRNPNQIKSATDNSGLFNKQNDNIYDPEPNGYLVFTNALNKLASLYGIKFNDITNAELNSEKWKSIIPDVNSVNAFVYNGQIYINIDKANLDAPIHEMMHILVGSIRFLNPNLYTELISLAEQFPNYFKLILKFPGRTRNDVNEEIFIEEVSRYLSGLPSNIANITPKLLYEISYNVKRLLDTILMGQDSVKTLSNDKLFSLSLKELALLVNSSIMKNNFNGTINVENSELHRKLNNIKSDLYNQGTLKEYCD